MKLLPKDWDEYNPVLVLMGAGFLVASGYPLLFMPGWSIAITWLVRGIFAIGAAMGCIILIRQIQLWRKRALDK